MVDADGGNMALGRAIEETRGERLLSSGRADHPVAFGSRLQAVDAESGALSAGRLDLDPAARLSVANPCGLAVRMAHVPVPVVAEQGRHVPSRATRPSSHGPKLHDPCEPREVVRDPGSDERVEDAEEPVAEAEDGRPDRGPTGPKGFGLLSGHDRRRRR